MGAKKARRADAGGALHARGLSASSRPASPSHPRRHSLWTFCRHLRGQDPPELTATVPAAAGDAPQGRLRGAQRDRAGGLCGCPGVWSGYGAATERRHASWQALSVLGATSGAALMRHSSLSQTAAPLRRTHAACRREGGQAPTALMIPAEPPPPLARGAPCIHGPSQQREISSRAPRRRLYTPNSGTKSTARHSRSVSLGPVQRGARTCEPCEGGGHRPG